MDNRWKRTFSLHSVCVGLTQAHILFLPQTRGPWKDCVPLCFSHSNMIHFVFIFFCLKHFFVINGWSTSERQKCSLCQSYAIEILDEEGADVLVNPKNGQCLNWFWCRNVLNRQRNCCEILCFQVFLGRCHSLWVTCFIDIFVEHLVLFWATLLLLDFCIFIHIDLRRNSCGPRIQSLNLPCFKSVEAQQGYRNVSCLQEKME